jgi:hypothetical protein
MPSVQFRALSPLWPTSQSWFDTPAAAARRALYLIELNFAE